MTPRNMARLGGLALTTALMTGVAAPAFAGSFYLQEQSVRGAGRAFSGEAADRGVGSMWWNPASIARSGREVSVGLHAIRIDSEVKNAGSYLTYPGGLDAPVRNPRNTEVDPIESGLVPNFAFATPIGDRFAVGVSVAAPYNFTTKYEQGSFARYDALTSELRSGDASLTVAYQVNDWLDVGAGLNAQFVKAKLTSAMPNLSPLLPDGSNLPWAVHALESTHPKRLESWIGHLRTSLRDLRCIRTREKPEDRSRYVEVEYANGLKAPSWLLSDGTLRMLALTILAYAPNSPSTILIEEPENGIHPQAIETVLQSLQSVYDAQVFLATHSPVVLSLLRSDHLLCFAKTASGAVDIVAGNEHPRLKEWKAAVHLGDLLATGVLG